MVEGVLFFEPVTCLAIKAVTVLKKFLWASGVGA
jgi:hypothetical protein